MNKGKKIQVGSPYPFLKSGSPGPSVSKELKHAVVSMFDMPGVAKEDVKIWSDHGMLHFHGESKKQPEYEYEGRVYGGSIMIARPELYKVDEPKADFKNGVLWITVPRLPLRSK